MGFFWFLERDEDGDKYRDHDDYVRRSKKSDEDVLIGPGRTSVYHLTNACFSADGMFDCYRVSRKEAEAKGYHLCKRCEKSYLKYYRGVPTKLDFD